MKMTLIRLKMEKKEKEKEGKLNLFQTPTWPPRYLKLSHLSLSPSPSLYLIYIYSYQKPNKQYNSNSQSHPIALPGGSYLSLSTSPA